MFKKNHPKIDSAKDDAAQKNPLGDSETVPGKRDPASEGPTESLSLENADSAPEKTPSSYDLTDEELSQAAAGGLTNLPSS